MLEMAQFTKSDRCLNMVVSGTRDQINHRKFYPYCQFDDLAK